MEPTVNESLKYVCRVKELVKTYLELNAVDNDALLYLAVELLDKTEEVLVKQG